MKIWRRMRSNPEMRFLPVILAISMAGSAPALSQSRADGDRINIREEVVRIQSNSDPEIRYKAIKRLAFDLHDDSSRVVESDVMALTELLRDSNDLVRHWTALALGQIGPRASLAVPALQDALLEVQCVRASNNSRFGITFALRRIGVSPTLVECVPTENYGLRNPTD